MQGIIVVVVVVLLFRLIATPDKGFGSGETTFVSLLPTAGARGVGLRTFGQPES